MRQLLLDLGADSPQTLATFAAGSNTELLQLLQRIAARESASFGERFVYLWGEPGSGKTHLLRALSATAAARYLPADAPPDDFLFSPSVTLYLLDDCERLSAERQVAAFALFNQARDNGAALVAAGAAAPMAMQVREDLRTRLGWGLVYQVHGLTDDEKIAALEKAAGARGLILSPGVLPYLLTHFRRDMPSLAALLDALDRYSLETQRPITLPLLRSLLQNDADMNTNP